MNAGEVYVVAGAFWVGEETVVEGQSELLITRAEADVAEWYPHL